MRLLESSLEQHKSQDLEGDFYSMAETSKFEERFLKLIRSLICHWLGVSR